MSAMSADTSSSSTWERDWGHCVDDGMAVDGGWESGVGPDGLFFFFYLLFYSFILESLAYYSFHSTIILFIVPTILIKIEHY